MTKSTSFGFLLTLILSFTFAAQAQKCEVDEDPISGKKRCQFMNKYQTLKYIYSGGDEIDFFTTFIYSGEQNVKFPAGKEVAIKLENGTIVQLKSLEEAVPQTKVSTSGDQVTVNTWYTFAFKLTKDQVKEMAANKVTFMRYPAIDGGVVDYDVKGLGKIYAKKITKGAECVSENLAAF